MIKFLFGKKYKVVKIGSDYYVRGPNYWFHKQYASKNGFLWFSPEFVYKHCRLTADEASTLCETLNTLHD